MPRDSAENHTVRFYFDGRQEMHLSREDVDLARIYLMEGYSRLDTAQEFRKSGYTITNAIAIAHCAAQEIANEYP